jgi:triacylglycerol esterase/lipase EstA (alpha/beta hydrolase family)
MTMKFSNLLAVLLVSTGAMAAPELSQPLEIKGISIGMPKSQIENIIRPEEIFTIGGVKSQGGLVIRDYFEGNLDQFIFPFKPSKFAEVYEAVKEKYPTMVCVESSVSNAMGATFKQTECKIDGTDSILQLVRMIDINTSALVLVSKRKLNETEKSKDHNKKDI